MDTVLNSPSFTSDWLKYEAENYFSRETGILASGAGVVKDGTVMAKVTASGKWVPAATGTSDGSQTALGVLIDPTRNGVDATSADKPIIVLTKHAIVSHAGLTYGATITNASLRAAANSQLLAVGIRVREGA